MTIDFSLRNSLLDENTVQIWAHLNNLHARTYTFIETMNQTIVTPPLLECDTPENYDSAAQQIRRTQRVRPFPRLLIARKNFKASLLLGLSSTTGHIYIKNANQIMPNPTTTNVQTLIFLLVLMKPHTARATQSSVSESLQRTLPQ